MAGNQIQIIITALDNTKAAFASLASSLNGTSSQLVHLKNQIKTVQEENSSLLADMKRNWLALSATIAAAAGAIYKTTSFLKDSTMIAARVETLGVVLEVIGRNAGYTKEQMEGYVDSVKNMGVTTSTASQTIIKMTQAQLDLNEASSLARVAQDAAVIGNINSSEALDRLLHGITTLQPEILRNIGIVVNFETEYRKVAQTTNRTTEQLSYQEKQQIALNAVLREGGKIAGTYEAAMGTAGKQLGSLERHVETLKENLGKLFTPSLLTLVESFTYELKKQNKAFKDNKEVVNDYANEFKKEMNNLIALAYRFGMMLNIIGAGFYAIGTAIPGISEDAYKKMLEHEKRFRDKEKALMDLAMRERGMRPATEKDAHAGNVKGLEYVEGFGTYVPIQREEQEKKEQEKKERDDTEANKQAIKKMVEQWEKTKAQLQLDIAKTGETEYTQRMIDLMWKAADLRKQFGDKPIIEQWYDAGKMKIEQAEADRQKGQDKRQYKEYMKAQAEIAEKTKEFEKSITEAKATELERRLFEVNDWADKELKTLDALAAKNINIQENYETLFTEIITIASKKRKMIIEENEKAKQEALMRYHRAQLESLIDRGIITKEEGYRREIDLTDKMIQQYEELRQKQAVGSEEWLDYGAEIEAMYKRRYELQKALIEQTGTLTEGLVEGIRRYIDSLNKEFQQGLAIVQQVAQGMENAFMNFFDKTSEGFMNFGKLAMSILNDIYRAVLRTIIVQPLVGAITKGIGGLFSSGGASSATLGTKIIGNQAVLHSGGLVMHSGGYIPRFHWGGLANDEVPAILQRGEYVVSRRGVAALDAINQGNISQPDVNVVVNVQNNTGMPVQAREGSFRFNGRQMVKEIILELKRTDPAFNSEMMRGH